MYRHIDRWEKLMFPAEIGSGVMINIAKFRKDWFRHSGGGGSQTHRQHGDHISLFHFIKVRKVG
jgi:hypothetical protein